MSMRTPSRAQRTESTQSTLSARKKTKKSVRKVGSNNGAGPIAFFVMVIIVIFSIFQFLVVFQTYAVNVSQLNSLKRQEASLIAEKARLKNQISRWNDDAYVTALARERLGFIYSGEKSVRLQNSTHSSTTSSSSSSSSSSNTSSKLPWYQEMLYNVQKADQLGNKTKKAKKQSTSSSSSTTSSEQ